MEEPKLFSTMEAASELGLSASTIRYMIATGQAKPMRKVGRGWLFDAAEIERLRSRQKQKGGRPKKQEVEQ